MLVVRWGKRERGCVRLIYVVEERPFFVLRREHKGGEEAVESELRRRPRAHLAPLFRRDAAPAHRLPRAHSIAGGRRRLSGAQQL